jgi:hypothetical protein
MHRYLFLLASTLAHKTDRQSPINIDTNATYPVVTSDPGFAQYYGKVSYSDMSSSDGKSVSFTITDKDAFFQTDLSKKWFPDEDFRFKPTQFHFHHGHGKLK